MKIVVLGSNGQLGSELKKSLEENYKPIFFTSKDLNITNFSSLEKMIDQEKPEILINAAAYTAVDKAESNIIDAFKVNDQAVNIIAKRIKILNSYLIHYSTDYVFDGKKKGKYNEDDETNPLSIYGKSKLAGENKIVQSGCNYFIFRTSWVCGESGKNFIKTIKNLSLSKKTINVVNDQLGVPTSTKLISKVTKYLISDICKNNLWNTGIYNLVPNGKTNWYEMATLISKIAINEFSNVNFKNLLIKKISSEDYITEAIRPTNSLLSNKKLQSKLNFTLSHWEEDFIPLVRKIFEEA